MAKSFGIELSDFGFSAAVHVDDGQPTLALPVEGESWPAFLSWDGRDFVLGREAERVSLLRPRWTSHTFWEHLSLAPADLAGVPRVPAYSELAYSFLRAFWETLLRQEGTPDTVGLALPGQCLPETTGDSTKLGLILGMAKDLRIPLSVVSGISIASFEDPSAVLPKGGSALYLDLHLHSAAMSLLRCEPDGTWTRQRHLRLPRFGYIPVLQGLTRAMANRFLRATAFDVSSQRRLEQAFYEQTRALLFASGGTTDCRFTLEADGRVYQAAFPHDTLRRDLQPFTDGWVSSVTKFLREAGLPPSEVVAVLSARTRLLPGLPDALEGCGIGRHLQLETGAGARGAAWIARRRDPCGDLAEVPVVGRTRPRQAGPDAGGLHVEHFTAPGERSTLAPSHLVVGGRAYPLSALPSEIVAQSNGRPAPIPALSSLGPFTLRLERRGEAWFLGPEPAPRAPVRLATGDRLRLYTETGDVELLVAAECPPGQA
jgi:hypothetical protein